MKTIEFNSKIESGEAKVMTQENVQGLIGKSIYWTYQGYSGNVQTVEKLVVGGIVSEFDYNKTISCEGYESVADRWEDQLSVERVAELKATMMVIDAEGKATYIRRYPNSVEFTCSDADRKIYFLLADED